MIAAIFGSQDGVTVFVGLHQTSISHLKCG